MQKIVTFAAALGLVAGAAFAAEPAGGPAMAKDGMFFNAKGMTLYTWDNDKEANKSSCNARTS